MTENDLRTNIQIIKNDLGNLATSFREFRDDQKELMQKMDVRMSSVEVSLARQGEKVSNLAIFQSAFSIIIGAIATYLGINRK